MRWLPPAFSLLSADVAVPGRLGAGAPTVPRPSLVLCLGVGGVVAGVVTDELDRVPLAGVFNGIVGDEVGGLLPIGEGTEALGFVSTGILEFVEGLGLGVEFEVGVDLEELTMEIAVVTGLDAADDDKDTLRVEFVLFWTVDPTAGDTTIDDDLLCCQD